MDKNTQKKNFQYQAIFLFSLAIIAILLCQNDQNSNIRTNSESNLGFAKFYSSKNAFEDLFKEIKFIKLDFDSNFCLSARPQICAVNQQGDIIILDNFNVRQILVFDNNGKKKAKIGSEGKENGKYLFPKSVFYQPLLHKYYIYDGDLLRISEYNEDFSFSITFQVPFFLDEIIINSDKRIFGYTSTTIEGHDGVVHELNWSGKIVNSFAPQSRNFIRSAASEGGGILLINQHLYVITPYEYTLSKYELSGKLIKKVKGESSHYLPPSKNINEALLNDLYKLQQFHNSWSHIRQIIQIGDKMIGVVFAEPGEARVFLDIYDTNLNYINGNILLPDYVIGPKGLFMKGDYLYLLRQAKPSIDMQLVNPKVVVYSLEKPSN